MSNIESVERAQANARQARVRLITTLEALQARLRPRRLMDEAIGEVRARSVELVEDAGRAARQRPVTVAAGTLAGMALLFHKPLWQLGRRWLGGAKETSGPDLGLEADDPQAKG